MITHSTQNLKNQLNKVISYAKKQLATAEADLFSDFLTVFYSRTSADDLNDKSVADLYAIAFSFWSLMRTRNPHEHKIRVFNPSFERDGWQTTHTIIQVITDDMPFLVDSLLAELNRTICTVHLTIYTGGMKVKRNDFNEIIKIYNHEDSETETAIAEAPIYFEIDKLTDTTRLADIENRLLKVLNDVNSVVSDWDAMQLRMRKIISEIKNSPYPKSAAVIEESSAFLEWLLNDNFTFLGARDYEVIGKDESLALQLKTGSGLGVLRDESRSKKSRYFTEIPQAARDSMLDNEQMLVISKTNTLATVHRLVYSDYIGVKQFNAAGELIGERRFIGLYTSTAYNSNPETIPFLRQKVTEILKKSELPLKSHAGKALRHILATLPRDDLFQGSIDELYTLSMEILYLQERRRTKLLIRKDAYGRFLSCLVYLPRENFNTNLVNRIRDLLQEIFESNEVTISTQLSESVLARIHYMVRLDRKKKLHYDVKVIENRLVEMSKSWQDGLRESVLEHFGEEYGNRLLQRYQNAFPAGYREVFSPRNAVFDIENIEKLLAIESDTLGMSFYRPIGENRDVIKFKLYRADETVPLSDALPMLENMGLRVIGEHPYQITVEKGRQIWIIDFRMVYNTKNPTFEVEDVKSIFQEAFNKIWLGEAENDSFNRLVLEAQLNWREISVLRAYSKYLRQIGFTFSAQYIAETFVNNFEIAKLVVELFKILFDPAKTHRKEEAGQIESLINKKLNDVAILDEDRILRRYLDVMHATLRTNYYQVDAQDQFKSYLSIKLNPKKIPELPLPAPKYEIFVYSPRFEGVHLRAGKVARGGIRWSDRREDFRTEILGLIKAQQVKNALIVPAGAKGGFVPKNLPVNATREAIMQEGITCYQSFIAGLLDLTDNLEGDNVIFPKNTVCYDDADPYLVVAADKGTATFSDIANAISIERNFWLGDAFASGGSSGYDHKKMGITARGAWVSAERHFQNLGINADTAEITTVGIGDLSGDVFGNGMLMSRHLKLVCAFNHQHIFIDPNPNPEISFLERQRLFNLPRSTWDDYDRKLISSGGGVFARNLKSIPISPEVKLLLGIEKDTMIPNELIKTILKAPIDLIWNGGIGTFVKASYENNVDVGDRTNDNIRINGVDLRARVVCEGGNLGLTQLARIEYELNGGKINTDFIDNSGGVDCSDHEVNIKIFLNALVTAGDMTLKQRNQLLAKMTDEVADLVLQNNYHQNLSISLASSKVHKHMGLYNRYINYLEEHNKIDRVLEFLPDNKTLLERAAAGQGLTRPELAILFSYSKIVLDSRIRKLGLAKDAYLAQYVKKAFPVLLRKTYGTALEKHRLSNEIISTQISNQLVSEMGITFTYQMHDETGAPTSAIVKSYIATREIFRLADLYADIEALDYRIDTETQYNMLEEVVRLIRRGTRWFLRNKRGQIDISETIELFQTNVDIIYQQLPKYLCGDEKAHLENYRDTLITSNVPVDIAFKIASRSPMYHALNIIEAMNTYPTDIQEVAKTYFTLADRLGLIWFREQIDEYPVDDRWAVLAKSAYRADLDTILRHLTVEVLKTEISDQNIKDRVEAWFDKHIFLIERWNKTLADLRSLQRKEFAILAVAIRELSDLVQSSAAN